MTLAFVINGAILLWLPFVYELIKIVFCDIRRSSRADQTRSIIYQFDPEPFLRLLHEQQLDDDGLLLRVHQPAVQLEAAHQVGRPVRGGGVTQPVD